MLTRTSRKGAAAVEFVVIVPVFLLILCGAVEFGGVMIAEMTLDEAAHQACRAATLPTGSNSQISADVAAVLQVHNISDPATITVQVNGVTADANTAKQNDKVSVEVAMPYSNFQIIPSFLISGDTVMTSKPLVMMRQR